MGNFSNKQLMRLDEQIINLEYLYQRELQREAELGKHLLLLSRGFRYRLDELYKAKAALIKATGAATGKRTNYTIILAERKNEYDDAQKELAELYARRDAAVTNALVHNSPEYAQEAKDLGKEIISQRTRIRNKKRALDNWVNKGDKLQIDAREYVVMNTKNDVIEVRNPQVNLADVSKRFQEHLESLKASSDVNNNATLDMLSRPEENKGE